MFIQKLILVVLFLGQQAIATEKATVPLVPALGSTWESTLIYKQLSEYSPQRRSKEVSTVVRMKDGRPVFAGEVFGYKGEILETRDGTVVYTDDCKDVVGEEKLLPPEIPNQCVWHVCNAPEVGKTFIRSMIFYVKLYSCQPKVATYTITSKRMGKVDGKTVTIGEAKVYISPFNQTSWTSYIQEGYGEIGAESPGRVTTYQRIEVTLVEYQPKGSIAGDVITATHVPALEQVTTSAPKQCDVVAFGDSLTEGMGASQSESYPAWLSKLLGIEVCNLGVSGNTTETAKQRIPEVLVLSPKVVIITLGANDAFQGVSPKTTEQNLSNILDALLKKDILVIILGFDSVAKGMPKYVGEMLAVYKVAKNRENILYLPDVFTDVLDTKNRVSSDGLHPNAQGYEKLAKNIVEQAFGALLVIPSLGK